jgi:hypothetical protein
MVEIWCTDIYIPSLLELFFYVVKISRHQISAVFYNFFAEEIKMWG